MSKWKFQTFQSGYIEPKRETEPLLPTNVQVNENTNSESDQEEVLLPIGVKPKDNK